MDKMTLTPLGQVFTDYHLIDVGSGEFQLEHDFFIRQDLHIRTAAGGGGTELAEGIDFTLTDEDTYLSQLVTDAVGAGRNVMRTITIITVGYQSGNLYFSGKYVADALEAGDYTTTIIVASANHALVDGDSTTVIEHTTGASERTETLGPLQFNKGRRVTVWKMDTGAGEVKFVFSGTEKAKYLGVSYSNLYIGLQGQHVTLEARTDGWYIVDGIVQPVALEPDVGGGWHVASNPSTGTLSSKTTGWTADRFTAVSGGFEVDFTGTIPLGALMISVTFLLFTTAGQTYARRKGDPNISNTPDASQEYSQTICSQIGRYQIVLDLSSDQKEEFAVVDALSDLSIFYPRRYCLGPA